VRLFGFTKEIYNTMHGPTNGKFLEDSDLTSGGRSVVIEANALASTVTCTQKVFGWILDAETGSPDSFFVISVTFQTYLKE
jgi:hypothetical protein